MNRAKPAIRTVARRLIAHESNGDVRSEPQAPVPFGDALEKLRAPLSELTGVAGYRSLVSRALALASGETRWLRAVHVKADGRLELPDLTGTDEKDIAEGEAALLTHMLGLLVTFIGGTLTWRLVQDVWPAAAKNKLDFTKEEQ